MPLDQNLETFQLKHGFAINARIVDCRWRVEPMDYVSADGLSMQAALRERSKRDQPTG